MDTAVWGGDSWDSHMQWFHLADLKHNLPSRTYLKAEFAIFLCIFQMSFNSPKTMLFPPWVNRSTEMKKKPWLLMHTHSVMKPTVADFGPIHTGRTGANGTYCCECEWKCSHWTQATSKDLRVNLRAGMLCGLGLTNDNTHPRRGEVFHQSGWVVPLWFCCTCPNCWWPPQD